MNRRRAFFITLFFVNIFVTNVSILSQNELKIMPLGNSITRGSMCVNGTLYPCEKNEDWEAIGYRKKLYDTLNASGYNVNYLGNLSYGYALMNDPSNAGFPGIGSNALADIFETGSSGYTGQVTPGPYLNYFPSTEIILLHIGTNDILAYHENAVVSHVNRLLDAIDDYETSSENTILVFVSTIVSQRDYPCNTHSNTVSYNLKLKNLVQTRINAGDKLELVDMECNAGINYYTDFIDEVHPNSTGYIKMADLWFEEVYNYNCTPVVTQIPDQSRDRGTTAFNQIILDNYVTDAEDNTQDIHWSVNPSQPQYFNISIDVNRIATITPKDIQWSGTESIEFVATDNGKVISSLRKSVAVPVDFTVNWIPEITGQEVVSINEDQPYTLTPNDLIITGVQYAPEDLSLIVQNGPNYSVHNTTITPFPDYYGELTVPVKITGNSKESDIFYLSVEVRSVNDIPVIDGQNSIVSTLENSCIEIDLSMLDVSDVETSNPSGLTINILNGINYSHSGNYICPADGFNGTLTVNIRVSDGQDNSAVFGFEIEVLALNPVFIIPADLETFEDSEFDITIALNHYDAENFSISAPVLPDWLNFYPSTKVLTGIPRNKDVGENYITLSATNGAITEDTTFIVTVTNVNDPPVILSDPVVLAWTSQEYIYLIEAEDYDPGDEIDITVTVMPDWTIYDPQSKTISGLPARGDLGSYTISLSVTDGEYVVSQNFNLEVLYYNAPPRIITEPKDTVEIYITYTYGFLAEDLENDPVSYFVERVPDWLEFYPATHVLIGTPSDENAGPNEIVLAATDGQDTTFLSYQLYVRFPVSSEPIPISGVTIYPNPAGSLLNIVIDDHLLNEKPIHFSLIDLYGKIIFKEVINKKHTSIGLDQYNVENGIYLINIYNSQNINYSNRIIIQN